MYDMISSGRVQINGVTATISCWMPTVQTWYDMWVKGWSAHLRRTVDELKDKAARLSVGPERAAIELEVSEVMEQFTIVSWAKKTSGTITRQMSCACHAACLQIEAQIGGAEGRRRDRTGKKSKDHRCIGLRWQEWR